MTDKVTNSKQLESELDKLEARIGELRVLYEQYFIDVQPHPPDKLHQETTRFIRKLLRAPFKNSQIRFRLRMLVQRFQTYATYWERVLKQKEDGTYCRDLFKAEMREKLLQDIEKERSARGKADKGFKQLYDSYEAALRKTGANTGNINFDAFKTSLMKQAKTLKDQTGVTKLQYKIVIKDGKVVVKASGK